MHEGEAMTDLNCKCGCGRGVNYPQRDYATPECRIAENARRAQAAYQPVKGQDWQYKRRVPEEIAPGIRRRGKHRDVTHKARGRPVNAPFETFIMQKCSNCQKSFPIPPDEKRITHYCPLCKGNWGTLSYAV